MLFIAVPTVCRSRGSREVRPQERRKTSPRSFKPRNARSDYSSKMPIDTAYRNTWIIIHVKGVNKQFTYREQNAHSIIKTLKNIKIHLLATASGLRSILQRHLANAITTPSTFFQVSVRRSDTPRLTSRADPYRRRSTLNMPSGLPSWHVISNYNLPPLLYRDRHCRLHSTAARLAAECIAKLQLRYERHWVLSLPSN